jgi:hypothetical protein
LTTSHIQIKTNGIPKQELEYKYLALSDPDVRRKMMGGREGVTALLNRQLSLPIAA